MTDNIHSPHPSSTAQKVALVIPHFAGGGAERAAINLAQALKSLHVPVRFIVERNNGALAGDAQATAPIDVLHDGGMRPAIRSLRNHMRNNPDTAYISFMTRSNIISAGARYLMRNRPILIMTEHNNRRRLLQQMKPHRRALIYTALLIAFRQADKVICVSDGVMEITKEMFSLPRKRLGRIYNPIITSSVEAFAEKARAQRKARPQRKCSSEKVLITSAGRLHPQKDFSTLIKAASILRDHGRTFQLQIFGEGPERTKLKALIDDLDLRQHVSLPGFETDLLSKISQADLFVLSSRWEGFGNVIAEALACGVPVVSTNCESGPREILDNGRLGPLTPVGDADALAEAIMNTLDKKLTIADDAADRFTATRAAMSYLSVLDMFKTPKPGSPFEAQAPMPVATSPSHNRAVAPPHSSL